MTLGTRFLTVCVCVSVCGHKCHTDTYSIKNYDGHKQQKKVTIRSKTNRSFFFVVLLFDDKMDFGSFHRIMLKNADDILGLICPVYMLKKNFPTPPPKKNHDNDDQNQ